MQVLLLESQISLFSHLALRRSLSTSARAAVAADRLTPVVYACVPNFIQIMNGEKPEILMHF